MTRSPGAAPDARRRRWLLAATALPLAGCGVFGPTYEAGPAQPVPAPRVNVGDRWRYDVTNLFNGLSLGPQSATITQADARGFKVALAGGGVVAPNDEAFYADPWRIIDDPSYGALQVFRDPVPMLPSRLQAGVSEHMSTTYQVAGASAHFQWRQWLEAPGWERVRVPAGEFLCLRVERHILFEHPDVFRVSPERWDTLWYAPEVRRWVQRIWTGYYLWPGGRAARFQEPWVRWQLLDHTPAPVASDAGIRRQG